MARYTGPVFRKARRLKFSILETNKEFSKGKKRTTNPGQHGQARSFKQSNYAKQLAEKQKVKLVYGLTEKQLRLTFVSATKEKGIIWDNLLIHLESRLDNIVYRLNFASTRKAARQMVNHGNILVDGKKVDIASSLVKVGSKIGVKMSQSKNVHLQESLRQKHSTLDFVSLNAKTLSGVYLRKPRIDELNSSINGSLIVEYYKRLV